MSRCAWSDGALALQRSSEAVAATRGAVERCLEECAPTARTASTAPAAIIETRRPLPRRRSGRHRAKLSVRVCTRERDCAAGRLRDLAHERSRRSAHGAGTAVTGTGAGASANGAAASSGLRVASSGTGMTLMGCGCATLSCATAESAPVRGSQVGSIRRGSKRCLMTTKNASSAAGATTTPKSRRCATEHSIVATAESTAVVEIAAAVIMAVCARVVMAMWLW